MLVRNERRRRSYTPEEVRARLQERHAEAVAAAPERTRGREQGHLPDPERIARHETDAWVGYYRREWSRVLRGALGMVREGFGTSGPQTVRGAWWVLRANQAWAPYPANDPAAARALMARFYAIAARAQGWAIDPAEAARLEVEWWAAHREIQREDGQGNERLVAALTALYAYVYSVPGEQVRRAAEHRAAAMVLSDAWVDAGCRRDDVRLAEEEAELVLSYAALRDGVRPRPS